MVANVRMGQVTATVQQPQVRMGQVTATVTPAPVTANVRMGQVTASVTPGGPSGPMVRVGSAWKTGVLKIRKPGVGWVPAVERVWLNGAWHDFVVPNLGTDWATAFNTGAGTGSSLGIPMTAASGTITLSPASPTLFNTDLSNGVIQLASSGTPWQWTIKNCRIRGTQLAKLTTPYSQNFESSQALIKAQGSSNSTGTVVDTTLIPYYPDPRWDCWYGHDINFVNTLMAHATDGGGQQNIPNPTGPANITYDHCFAGFPAYFGFSPGSGNSPPHTHNDAGMQILGGSHFRIIGGTTIHGYVSSAPGTGPMDDPFTGPNWVAPGNDTRGLPWDRGGFVGDGVLAAGQTPDVIRGPNGEAGTQTAWWPRPNTNAGLMVNHTQSAVSDFLVDTARIYGGNIGVNIDTIGGLGMTFRNLLFDHGQTAAGSGDTTSTFFGATQAGVTVESTCVYEDNGHALFLR